MNTKTPLIVSCPTCRRDVNWHTCPQRPFCSERCRTADLGAWAEERYAITDEEASDESDGSTFIPPHDD